MIVKDVLCLLFLKDERYVKNKQLNKALVLKKVGSHGDHREVLLACQDEKIGHRKLFEQVSQ